MSDKALMPIEQRTVTFYNDEITAVLVAAEQGSSVYIPIRPICDFMGLNWDGQRRRILRDPVLAEEMKGVVVTTTPSATGRGGGPQEMVCLPLKFIPGFLFGINADRVKSDLRDKIIRYQRECYDVLAEAFREGRLTSEPDFSQLLSLDTPAVQAYKAALAVVQLARQQVIIEAQLADHEQRLESIEATLSDSGRFISKEQAMHISQAVKAVALALGKKTGRNEFQGVYGELYRRFRIPSYRELPAHRFNEAMAFLREWYETITDDDVPF
jgi:hypothetical protein